MEWDDSENCPHSERKWEATQYFTQVVFELMTILLQRLESWEYRYEVLAGSDIFLKKENHNFMFMYIIDWVSIGNSRDRVIPECQW